MLAETPVSSARDELSKSNSSPAPSPDIETNRTRNLTSLDPNDSLLRPVMDSFYCNQTNGIPFSMNTGGNYQKQPTMAQQQPNNNYSQDLFDYNVLGANNFIFDQTIQNDDNPNVKMLNKQSEAYLNFFYHNQNPNANKFQHQMFQSQSTTNNNKAVIAPKNGKNVKSLNVKNSNKILGSNVKNVWVNNQNPSDSWLPTYNNSVSKFDNDNSQQSANNIGGSGSFSLDTTKAAVTNQLDPSTIIHHSSSQSGTITNTTGRSKLSSPFNMIVGGSGNLINDETQFHPQQSHSSLNNNTDQMIDHPMMFLQNPEFRDIYNSLVQNDDQLLDPNLTSWNSIGATRDTWDSNKQRNHLMSNSNNISVSPTNNLATNNDSAARMFNVWSGIGSCSGSANAPLVDPLLDVKMNIHSGTVQNRSSSGVSSSGRTSNPAWPLDQWGAGPSAMLNDGNLQSSSSTSSTPMPISMMYSNQTNKDIDRNKQSKLLLDFYHDNLKYFINEDLQMTKILLDFYHDNFYRNTSNDDIKNSRHKNFELEQNILRRLLSTEGRTSESFQEFDNIFLDLHERGQIPQYLDKVLFQTKFEELKSNISILFSGNFPIESNTNASSFDQNNAKMIGEQLKNLQLDTTQLREANQTREFQIWMLRLLKYYKKIFDFIPKEILLNLSLIHDMSQTEESFREFHNSFTEGATSEDSVDDLSDEGEDSIMATKDDTKRRKLEQSYRRFIQNLKTINKKAQDNQETARNNDVDLASQQKKEKKKMKSKPNDLKKHKMKAHPQIIAVKMEQSFYLPYYYPMSPESLNLSGPIIVFFNRATKPLKSSIENINQNWTMIESIEHEIGKSYNTSGFHGALVFEPRLETENSDGADDSNIVVPTSLSKLINKLKELFPRIPTNQLMEITRQGKYIMMKRYKIQYGFSGIKMGNLVKFIADLIIENGISAPPPSSDNSINETNSKIVPSGSTPATTTCSTVSKGITWSKIAAQSNTNNNSVNHNQSNHTGSFGTTSTISPIMKPTPSSTPLSTTSSSSLSSSTSMMMMLMNNGNNINKLNNIIQMNPIPNSNLMSALKTPNVNSNPCNSMNNLPVDNNNCSNNCALCKGMVVGNGVSKWNTPSKALTYLRMNNCRHLFHKECLENIASQHSLLSPLSSAESIKSAIFNNQTCPMCEKLFVLKKDDFPSLN